MASRSKAHARAHHFNSARGFVRASNAKNAAIIASDDSWTSVLHRHKRSCWASFMGLPSVGRDIRHRFIAGKSRFEYVNSGEAIHIAADRHPEKIQDCRGEIDDRCTIWTSRRHCGAQCEHETV